VSHESPQPQPRYEDRATPASRTALLQRAHALAGFTIGELGRRFGRFVPEQAGRAKGLAGQLLELALGADAGNLPQPDFRELAVELKTIPLDRRGRPREGTFVCSIPLSEVHETEWPQSRTYSKLRCVLWVPIEAEKHIPLPERRVGYAQLWSPDAAQELQLRRDWEELTGLIATGEMNRISAHLGTYLQIRPKAAHSQVRTTWTDEYGAPTKTLPLGFYLRSRFTATLFEGF